MFFLVKGKVKITPYMAEPGDIRQFDELRLVEAPDEDQAGQAFIEYFESKTDAYAVYYAVDSVEVFPPIISGSSSPPADAGP